MSSPNPSRDSFDQYDDQWDHTTKTYDESYIHYTIEWKMTVNNRAIMTHLLNPFCVMEGCIIHNKNRLRSWPWITQKKKLLYVILKYGTICGSLEDTCEDNTVLCIRRQNLISLLTLELRNLGWSYTKRSPTSASKSNAFITARLIHENVLLGTDMRCVI
jgi:hypothetical protein